MTTPAETASPDENNRLIETLYQNSIEDIRHLKIRQWDVTKWVLAANVALLFPIVTGKSDGPPIENSVLCMIGTLSLVLGGLGVATIIKTQCSLLGTRLGQRKWRKKHPDLNAADKIVRLEDGKKKCRLHKFWNPSRTSLCYDWPVWLPMLAISLVSSGATIVAAFSKVTTIVATSGALP